MLECPLCKEQLHWQSDNDDGEVSYGYYTCDPCKVEVFIGIGDYKEDEED